VRLLHQYFFAKKLQSQTVTREKLPKALLYKKIEPKIWMKLTPFLVAFFNSLSILKICAQN